MKNSCTLKHFLLLRKFCLALLLLPGIIFGQSGNAAHFSTGKTNFTEKPFAPFFVENKGQFDQYINGEKNIAPMFGAQVGNTIVLLAGNKIEFVETTIENKENESGKNKKDLHEERIIKTYSQTLEFVNATMNSNFAAPEY